jgi:hypothetical protein
MNYAEMGDFFGHMIASAAAKPAKPAKPVKAKSTRKRRVTSQYGQHRNYKPQKVSAQFYVYDARKADEDQTPDPGANAEKRALDLLIQDETGLCK